MLNADNPGEGSPTVKDLTKLGSILDPEIKSLVLLLIANGFDTFSSCSGKKNHAFRRPTIRLNYNSSESEMNSERGRLHEFLKSRNYQDYSIAQVYEYNCAYNFLELEFYSLSSLIP